MTSEEKRLILLNRGFDEREEPEKYDSGLSLDYAGLAFFGGVMLIGLFAWVAGQLV